MTQPLPPKPVGDVAGTWAVIKELNEHRKGLTALGRAVNQVTQGAEHLSGIYMLSVSTYRVTAAAQVGLALSGVDAAIDSLTTAVRQLERDLRNWQATCDRIRAAQ